MAVFSSQDPMSVESELQYLKPKHQNPVQAEQRYESPNGCRGGTTKDRYKYCAAARYFKTWITEAKPRQSSLQS